MRVYPELESWDEFYPNEIFIRMDGTEGDDDVSSVIKKAHIGSTIYIGALFGEAGETTTYKKVGDFDDLSDPFQSLLILGYVTNQTNQGG